MSKDSKRNKADIGRGSRDEPAGRRLDHAADSEPAGPPLPLELETLDDAEVVELVREAFRTEVGEALDGVRVRVHDGIVTLTGDVPNETLPEIARRIIEDEVGYEVVDRILVGDTAGGPQAVDEQGVSRHIVPDETLMIDDEDLDAELSEDILETEEEGLVFVPPTRPVPER
jgi:hypothetical protein